MKDFAGKTAIVTGGGTGMGRELVRQLVAEGCNVAICDVSARNMAETVELCMAARPPQGTRVTAHVADVSDRIPAVSASATSLPSSTRPTNCICCSTMPASAAAAR